MESTNVQGLERMSLCVSKSVFSSKGIYYSSFYMPQSLTHIFHSSGYNIGFFFYKLFLDLNSANRIQLPDWFFLLVREFNIKNRV